MSAYEIIEALLAATGLNQAAFLTKSKVSSSTFSELKSGKIKKISPTLARKIHAAFPQFNESWLLTGVGDMYASGCSAPVFQNSGDHVSNHQGSGIDAQLLDLLKEKDRQIDRLLSVVENLSKGGCHD